MGYATMSGACGCRQTRLLEPTADVWITYVRCAAHYEPARDDPRILEAERNRRHHEQQVQEGH